MKLIYHPGLVDKLSDKLSYAFVRKKYEPPNLSGLIRVHVQHWLGVRLQLVM